MRDQHWSHGIIDGVAVMLTESEDAAGGCSCHGPRPMTEDPDHGQHDGDVGVPPEMVTLRRATALSGRLGGEGLRALALAWLGIALGLLGAAALLGTLWWLAAVLALVAAAVGVAYWWVVPAPFGLDDISLDHAARRLDSTLALADAATRWTVVGAMTAAGVTAVGIVTTDLPVVTKAALIAGCVGAALMALRWARSRFVWREEQPGGHPRAATVLYNGRFLLGQLHRLHADMARIRALERPLIERERTFLDQALIAAPGETRRAILVDLLAVHAQHSRLLAVHDPSRIAMQDVMAGVPRHVRREKRVTALWMVPRVWLWIIMSTPYNLLLWVQLGGVNGRASLDYWQAMPHDQFRYDAELRRDALAQMEQILDGGGTLEAKRTEIVAVLEWGSSTQSESRNLERLLAEWFG